jgi:mannose-6-phosphate isomerase-like protein (cupin superfamily)
MAQKVDLSSEYCFIGEGEMTLHRSKQKIEIKDGKLTDFKK